MWRNQLAELCATTCLVLTAGLPFLVPFIGQANVDLQAWILIIAGGFGWIALLTQPKAVFRRNYPLVLGSLLMFGLIALVSAFVNPHLGYNLLGAPWLRLGALGYLACIGCALVVQAIPLQRLLRGLYLWILALGILSVPYSLWRFQSLERLPGIFAQADVMAVFMGIGLVLGLGMVKTWPKWSRYLWCSQILLASFLLLTQTRAVIVLTILVMAGWQLWHRTWGWQQWLAGVAIVCVIIGGAGLMGASRLVSHRDLTYSGQYLVSLQSEGLKGTANKPVLGYGPGNLADALDCRKLTAPELINSCGEGFYFNSSHNIFVDRLLGVGWLGGLAYAVFVVSALVYGFKQTGVQRVLALAALLIALYYFTNVTSAILELLFVVLLLRAACRED